MNIRPPKYKKSAILNNYHWIREDYAQRITVENWRQILLNNDDNLTFEGLFRHLKAKKLGYGVVEVSKVKKGGILK